MVSVIEHVVSRCGGGKSVHTVEQLHIHLEQQTTLSLVLFASKTNALTQQNHDRFQGMIDKSGSHVQAVRIDTTTQGLVMDALSSLLSSKFKGVVFISHHSLAMIKPELLAGVSLFIDEVPQELVKYLSVKYEAQDGGAKWENFITTTKSPHSGYQKVILNPQASTDDIRRFIINVLEGRDNSTSKEVASLLLFLLDDYEVLYTTTTDSNNRVYKLYQTTHWLQLKGIVDNVNQLVILSAQLEHTLFGFIAKNLLNLKIVQVNITSQLSLEARHKNKVRILPLLEKGSWSAQLKSSLASEKLVQRNKLVTSDLSVSDYAQEFVSTVFKNEEFVLTLNNREELIGALQKSNVKRTSSAVHGLNKYRDIHHAAYLSSTRPSPFEIKALRLFASDHGLDGDALIESVIAERCYEASYQCLARTSIRSPQANPEMEHLFIVPDMKYAKYIATWFEDGCANIDTTRSFATVNAEDQESAFYNRRQIVIRILTDKKNKVAKVSELLKREGISQATFSRYKREHRDNLIELGLVT